MENNPEPTNPPTPPPPAAPPAPTPPAQAPTPDHDLHGHTLIAVILLVLVYPIGLFFMWFMTKWPRWVKILITLPVILGVVGLALALLAASKLPKGDVSTNTTYQQTISPTPNPIADETADWKLLVSTACKFSLKYPPGWQEDLVETKACQLEINDPSRGKNQFFVLTTLTPTTWQSELDSNKGGTLGTFAGTEAYIPKPVVADATGKLNSIFFHNSNFVYVVSYADVSADPSLTKTYQQILSTINLTK